MRYFLHIFPSVTLKSDLLNNEQLNKILKQKTEAFPVGRDGQYFNEVYLK